MKTLTEKDIVTIFDPKTIRKQCGRIFDLAKDRKTNFNIHLDKLDACADFVVSVIKDNYPDLNIPFHSRWGHFKAGQINRVELLDAKLKSKSPIDKAISKLDLAIVSVLLDAGAGMEWSYNDHDGKSYSKSEGLAIASLNMFLNGSFSSNNNDPLRVDADALMKINNQAIIDGFQVTEKNPLVGIDGRVQVLKNLGMIIKQNTKYFPGTDPRPGNITNYFQFQSEANRLPASEILKGILYGMGNMWPARLEISGQNLGDVWHYNPLATSPNIDSLIPFHKLSQWMSYSLIEPIEEMGIRVFNLNELTGLPEYRNGGLFIDSGVLTLRNELEFEHVHTPDSPFIIEWRALTVMLLDQISDLIRKKLNKTSDDFPLVKILEGGTWWAGRRLAKEKRSDGGPPFHIKSDGTVF